MVPPPGVSVVTSEGPSRVEVTLDDDDDGVSDLSKAAGLHMGLADVKDAFHRFKISRLYSSFFALPEVLGEETEMAVDTHEEALHSETVTSLANPHRPTEHVGQRCSAAIVAPEAGSLVGLRCWALPGRTRKVFLGHMTFVALLRQDVLSRSTNSSVHDKMTCEVVADCQSRSANLHRTLANNCFAAGPAAASLPLVATDASEHGYCVCLKECEKTTCETIGRTSE